MDSYLQYHNYLKQRSFKGSIYRRFFLYPRLARLTPGRTLDVGCGIGDFLKFKAGTIGVDVNPYNVEFCKEQKLSSYVMKPDALPFDAEFFDSVLLDNVLEHIDDPEDLLEEVWRVLKPQGYLVAGVPGRRGFQADPDHKVFYDEARLTARLERQNFRLASSHHFPMKSNYLDENMRQYTVFGVFRKDL